MELTNEKERFLFDRRLNVRQVQDCPIYAGMIEQLDQSIGTVLTRIDEHGLEDNTIICFTSDNGGVSSGDAYATSNLPLRGGKGRQWEGGIREPFILKLRESQSRVRKAIPRSMESTGTPPCLIFAESKFPKTKCGWSKPRAIT